MSFSNKKRAKAAKAVQATSTKPEFHLFTNIDVDNYKDLVGGNKGGGGGGGSDVQRGQGSVESMTTSRFEEDHVLAQRIENNQVPIPYLETAGKVWACV